jgi:hypothetical protein
MKKLYKRFEEIERLIRRGYITISEGNGMMLQAIREEYERFDLEGPEEWDSNKAYHKMYLILAKITRD